jgi:tetraacyldisaccharide 4'-kinase
VNPYGAVLRLRRRLYETGVLESRPAPGPSISIGNLTWGGAGKTPFVQWMARHYADRGLRVGVVLRGYRRKSRGVRVVSDGMTVLSGVEESGDEAQLHARRLPGAIVVVSEDRARGARRAGELGARLFLFDDAFQHLALRRDLDVVLLDADRPFGGGLPPRGRCREDPRALARADILVLTRCASQALEGEREVRRWNPSAPLFHSRFRFVGWIDERGAGRPDPPPRPLAFCSIADPDSFRATLEEAGVRPLELLEFRDHHSYSGGDLRRIEEAARRSGAESLVTTEKDLVKVEGRLRMPISSARIEPVLREPGFFETLDRLFREKGIVL